MKFGANFQAVLQRDEFPQEWIDSAISYKKLKKCIKRVQQELESIGLDHETLEKLWQQVVDSSFAANHHSLPRDGVDRMMNYDFLTRNGVKFTPTLTIALDPRDGSPMDAWLSPETRRVLKQLARKQTNGTVRTIITHDEQLRPVHSIDVDSIDSSESSSPPSDDSEGGIETVEIPLNSDSEFFQILRRELRNLAALQRTEQKQMEQVITELGGDLRALKESNKKRSKEEVEAWREIFRLYLDAQIFLSSHEKDAGARDATSAQKQLQLFETSLTSKKGNEIKLSREGIAALDRFNAINLNLLRLLKYQEINHVALTKILKKFDKRTALHAQQPVLQQLQKTQSFITQDLAKATCFTITDELLNIIPQLDDYLCPVCFAISFKPVRLRCNHVFCIRCLIVMQRADQDNCPLCREQVVLEASGENIDDNLIDFLKKNFPKDVKQKQRDNEIAAGVDQFGEGFTGTHKCVVM